MTHDGNVECYYYSPASGSKIKAKIKDLPDMITSYLHEYSVKELSNLRGYYSRLLEFINDDVKDSYLNMREIILQHPEILEYAIKGLKRNTIKEGATYGKKEVSISKWTYEFDNFHRLYKK